MRKCESLTVEMRPIDFPKPYSGNPRQISEVAVDKVAASIREFGWRQPVVTDRDGVIIVGHTRFLAAQRLGLKTVPVHIADLTPAKAKAYRLADNRVGEESRWDQDKLELEFAALADIGADLTLTGFDKVELPNADINFEPVGADDVKRLDRTSHHVSCPECGHEFET